VQPPGWLEPQREQDETDDEDSGGRDDVGWRGAGGCACANGGGEAVPGTLKVYYMKGYGAIEMGVHRFLHPKT
jgi:hypothetical protein